MADDLPAVVMCSNQFKATGEFRCNKGFRDKRGQGFFDQYCRLCRYRKNGVMK